MRSTTIKEGRRTARIYEGQKRKGDIQDVQTTKYSASGWSFFDIDIWR